MNKKNIFFAILFLLLSFNSWASDNPTTTMIGSGVTRDEAIQNGIRNAVESATGVFVYSTSEVKDFKLVRDQIVTASKGYVKDYKVISESKGDGIVFVTLNVSVDTVAIKSIIKRDIKTTTYEDALRDYASISSLIERNKKYASVLKSISSRPLDEVYNIQFSGYEIVNAGVTSADVILKFNITPNSFLWDTYYETVRLIQGHNADNNHIVINYNIIKKYKWGFDLAGERIYFHKDFNNYIIKPRQVTVNFELPEGRFKLKPFLVYDKYIDNRDYHEKNIIWIHTDQTATKRISDDSVGYFMGTEGVEFKTLNTFKNIDDIKRLPAIKVSLKEVPLKNVTYEWD